MNFASGSSAPLRLRGRLIGDDMAKLDYCGPSSAEIIDRHPHDRELREAGFEIHARPKTGPVLWRKRRPGDNDLICGTDDALMLAAKWRKLRGR